MAGQVHGYDRPVTGQAQGGTGARCRGARLLRASWKKGFT